MINRSGVPDYFHFCDLFVLPAIFDPIGNVDGCPNVILEAMACGKPVVASGISAIPIVVKDGETGILVEKKNIPQLVSALITKGLSVSSLPGSHPDQTRPTQGSSLHYSHSA